MCPGGLALSVHLPARPSASASRASGVYVPCVSPVSPLFGGTTLAFGSVPPCGPCQHGFGYIPVAQHWVPSQVYMLWPGSCGGMLRAAVAHLRCFGHRRLPITPPLRTPRPLTPIVTSCLRSMNALAVRYGLSDIPKYLPIFLECFRGYFRGLREHLSYGQTIPHGPSLPSVVIPWSLLRPLSIPHYCCLATIRTLQLRHKLCRPASHVFLSVRSIAWRRS